MDSSKHSNLSKFSGAPNETKDMYYEVWTVSEVAEHVNFLTKQLSGRVFGLSSQILKFLLDRYNWNSYQLSYDLAHKRKHVFDFANIKDPFKQKNKVVQKIKKLKKYIEDNRRCRLCNEVILNDFNVAHCKHNYCKQCWALCINTKYSNKDAVTCPESKCLVAYDTVMHYLKNSRIDHFQRLTISSFIKNDASYSWCPEIVGCSKLIKIMNPSIKKVACTCGMVFCFDCKEKWHSPIPCQMLKCWREMRINQIQSRTTVKCLRCTLIIRLNDECPQCSTVMEVRKKLVTDNFYKFSDLFRLYKFQDNLQQYEKSHFSSENCDEELQEVVQIVRNLGELRGVYKCCLVFAYFLRKNNHHAEVFCSNFKVLREIMNNLIRNIQAFCEEDTKEIRENIISYAKRSYAMVHTIESLCNNGFQNKLWNFNEVNLKF